MLQGLPLRFINKYMEHNNEQKKVPWVFIKQSFINKHILYIGVFKTKCNKKIYFFVRLNKKKYNFFYAISFFVECVCL